MVRRRALLVLICLPSAIIGQRVFELRGIMPHCPTSSSALGLMYGPRANGVT